MSERFERLAKMAKEEFGVTVIRSDKQTTFEDLFCVKLTESCNKDTSMNQYRECKYNISLPTVGICCEAYSKSIRPDGRWWAHFPICSEEKCPLLHPELLEDATLEREG